MYYPFLRCLLCKANSLMVSLHWQSAWCVLWSTCPMLPTSLWPHYSSHASTEPFRHICTLHLLLQFHVPLPFHWQLNTQQIYINATYKPLYSYTNRKLGQEHKIHAGYNTKYCSQGEHWNMKIFSTYSGTEDQCNVFMIANGSERNLRQGVVILWFRQCRIQEHHIILWVKNTLRLQHQEQSKIKISFKGKGQLNRLPRHWLVQHEYSSAGTNYTSVSLGKRIKWSKLIFQQYSYLSISE